MNSNPCHFPEKLEELIRLYHSARLVVAEEVVPPEEVVGELSDLCADLIAVISLHFPPTGTVPEMLNLVGRCSFMLGCIAMWEEDSARAIVQELYRCRSEERER